MTGHENPTEEVSLLTSCELHTQSHKKFVFYAVSCSSVGSVREEGVPAAAELSGPLTRVSSGRSSVKHLFVGPLWFICSNKCTFLTIYNRKCMMPLSAVGNPQKRI